MVLWIDSEEKKGGPFIGVILDVIILYFKVFQGVFSKRSLS